MPRSKWKGMTGNMLVDNLQVSRVSLLANQLSDVVAQSQFDKFRAVLILP